MLRRILFCGPETVLHLQAEADTCLLALEHASRPNLARLHLRNLFTEGRRYYLWPRPNGFWLTSNTRPPWRRGRTALAAVVEGVFDSSSATPLRLTLRARLRVLYFVDVFIIPAGLLLFLWATPWPRTWVLGVTLLLLALSWAGHWLAAQLQALEMVYFIRAALAELTVMPQPLPASAAVIRPAADAAFRAAWERFYTRRR